MKKEKLRIEELAVNSFVTSIGKAEKHTLNGGVSIAIISFALHAHEAYETVEATETIASIVTTVIRSAQTDCAGATREIVNCNATISPCKL